MVSLLEMKSVGKQSIPYYLQKFREFLDLSGRPRVRPPQGRGRGRGFGAADGPVVLGWVAGRPGREAARG
eukprot:8830718-Pyramimonas_sp.AAC.1